MQSETFKIHKTICFSTQHPCFAVYMQTSWKVYKKISLLIYLFVSHLKWKGRMQMQKMPQQCQHLSLKAAAGLS